MILDLTSLEKQVFKLGFVKMVDCMPRYIPPLFKELGCDSAIVQAARVSYGGESKSVEADKKLLRYLYRNQHTSPFEMVKLKFHVKMPIFVQRQWIRHRTASVNEISARYTQVKDEVYIPENLREQSTTNKQCSGSIINDADDELKSTYESSLVNNLASYELYEKLLEKGVARELARVFLPLNTYTEFYWCIDLHNFLHFVKLRNSPHAQYEIREYAKVMCDMVKQICPVTMECFEEYTLNSVRFSSKEIKVLSSVLDTSKLLNEEQLLVNKRENDELIEKLKLFVN